MNSKAVLLVLSSMIALATCACTVKSTSYTTDGKNLRVFSFLCKIHWTFKFLQMIWWSQIRSDTSPSSHSTASRRSTPSHSSQRSMDKSSQFSELKTIISSRGPKTRLRQEIAKLSYTTKNNTQAGESNSVQEKHHRWSHLQPFRSSTTIATLETSWSHPRSLCWLFLSLVLTSHFKAEWSWSRTKS